MSRALPIVAKSEPGPHTAEHPSAEHPSAFPVYRWRLRWRDGARAAEPASGAEEQREDRPAWPAPIAHPV